jgi:argininosuccinate lyase
MAKIAEKMDFHKKGPGVNSRFSEPPANEMVEYSYKLRLGEVRYIFDHELWNHKAHTVMLYEQRIMSRNDASKILTVLDEIIRRGADEFPLDPRKGELFFNIESYLIDKIGEDVAGKLHSGRSRGDMYVCTERMVLREKILQLIIDLISLIETLVEVSEKNVATIMQGYTLLQHAQPTTLAHYLMSFVDRFQRDIQRLQETYPRVNQSPMGAAIITGSGFPLNRPRMAELLGFDGVIENTRDASISRDFALEGITHTVMMLTNLSALVDDLNVWCSYEFGMIELSDAYSGTSSIMPQKKNPHSLERIRSLSAECIGNTMGVFAHLKTLSEQLIDLEAVAPLVWRTLDSARAAVKFTRGVMATLKVNKDLMLQRAQANFIQATQLAETIVKEKRLPFRTAHRIVGKLVKHCIDHKITPNEVTPDLLDNASISVIGRPLKMHPEILRKSLDVRYIIEKRNSLGGPGRKEVTRMLKKRSSRSLKDKEWLADRQQALQGAMKLTDSMMKRIKR